MELKFKNQPFQKDAADAVVDVFKGQPNFNGQQYSKEDSAESKKLSEMTDELDLGRIRPNKRIQISDEDILKNLRGIQQKNRINQSDTLLKTENTYNLTIEMETGVGKTYTYIKTIYELYQKYGWCKFIIIVPSIAVREGVKKTFEVTKTHFFNEYNNKDFKCGSINFKVYNSADNGVKNFAESHDINVLIMNSQVFGVRSADARRIMMPMDALGSERPIDFIAATNPILIIDEPQSVEGTVTREKLREFNPLLILRYSATHRPDSIYNMVYRLDAIDAINNNLVKKIDVTGIKISGTNAAEGFIYLERLNYSKTSPPTATIHFDCRTATGIRKVIRTLKEGDNIYELSGNLDEYDNNRTIKFIDGRENGNYVEFINGDKIFVGEVIGNSSEEQIRRIQIRETIKAHLNRENNLFNENIKVLSLFFIDKVKNYKTYDDDGNPLNGDFAKWFEEEYTNAVKEFDTANDGYKKYLEKISVDKTHAGYFSIDKKGRLTDSKISGNSQTSDDVDAYNLIMRNKELLLDTDAEKSPVRFIFSHSALREGWDNPNVFQICTLKQSSSDIRKRQEVGRGLRLCVNQNGERIEKSDVNLLTVIASESYEDFTRKLQTEFSEAVSDRPRTVTTKLFVGKKLSDGRVIDERLAKKIYNSMIRNIYVDDDGMLTANYFDAVKNNTLTFVDDVNNCKDDIKKILDEVYRPADIGNSREKSAVVKVKPEKFNSPEFQSLWDSINPTTDYTFEFSAQTLIDKAADAINKKLDIPEIFIEVTRGSLKIDVDVDKFRTGTAFSETSSYSVTVEHLPNTAAVQFSIVDKLVDITDLTRKDIVEILARVDKNRFAMIINNPEDFTVRVGRIINAAKNNLAVENVKYTSNGGKQDANIFENIQLCDPTKIFDTSDAGKKHLFTHVIYDSAVEKNFADNLENSNNIKFYIKLPPGYVIPTPVGNYNPDWAIIFNDGDAHFVAETKGSTDDDNLRGIELAKTYCAKKHFEAIKNSDAKYIVVDGFTDLLKKFYASRRLL